MVLVIGGGIGGLATAVALNRVGIEAHVYERAPQIREVGAGLTIWSNAMKALRRIGLEGQALALGAPLRKVHTLAPNGKIIGSEDLEKISRSCGAPSICIHRGDLQRILADALDPELIHTGKECCAIEQNEAGATARFADGTEASGEIVIAADGLRSAVRRALFGEEPLRYCGYYCYRAITDASGLPSDEAIFGMLHGIQLGFFPFGREGKVYWFICPNAPAGHTSNDYDHLARIRQIAGNLPPYLATIMTGTPEENLIIGEAYDRPPRPEWRAGRGILLGDAAHPTTPNLGQGACMAIEDAIVLADSLRRAKDFIGGLEEYERRRRKRTAMITNRSGQIGRIYHMENPLLVRLRTLMFRLPVAAWIGRKTQRSLLSYEPPEL